jgi:hypothetical protein
MNRTFKTLCHEQHRIDPRLKADGWECFKALFVELNNGRNQFAEQDQAEAKRKLVSLDRNGDCNVKLIKKGLKGRKISWSYPHGGVRLYGTVVDVVGDDGLKIKHDEPFQDIDHPEGKLVNDHEVSNLHDLPPTLRSALVALDTDFEALLTVGRCCIRYDAARGV